MALMLIISLILSTVECHHENSTANATIECPIRQGLISNPEKACDHYFYYCDEYVGVVRTCAADLFFDLELKECDYWYKIQACSGATRMTGGTTTSRPAMSTMDPKLRLFCLKRQDGDYPDELAKNCSNRFFTCSSGILYLKYCRPGLYFDPEHNWCDRHDNIFACTGVQQTEASKGTTTTSVQNNFDCTDKVNGRLYPNPEQPCANHYFMCSGGYANRMPCSATLYFDYKLQDCTYKQDVAECDKSYSKPASTFATKPRDGADVETTGHADKSTPSDKNGSSFTLTTIVIAEFRNRGNPIGTTAKPSSPADRTTSLQKSTAFEMLSTSTPSQSANRNMEQNSARSSMNEASPIAGMRSSTVQYLTPNITHSAPQKTTAALPTADIRFTYSSNGIPEYTTIQPTNTMLQSTTSKSTTSKATTTEMEDNEIPPLRVMDDK